MLNDKKTEVTHIRMSSTLLDLVRLYHEWRKQIHPRLKQQDALRELVHIGLEAVSGFRKSIGQQELVEQAVSRGENADFATKFLGDREAVASQY